MIKKITFFPILFITLLFSTQISAEVIVEVGSGTCLPVRLLRLQTLLLCALWLLWPRMVYRWRIYWCHPWFHGSHDFLGHVDNRFDPYHGYHGAFPERGDKPFNHFRGNEIRSGRGFPQQMNFLKGYNNE
ncbi:hypothetical protein ARAF_2569 [Arsenophonus endosymbiont of Aleurodicus floccissimus]|uniref:hypothetical protein n=1 Tax=Arsenophonus endosymbiont of Aleurodicus floccissimus TaxID=2152761 RepID=UPI000E6B4D2C|nr:hypothetical protein [Arsenophonus endosymbiont of Aleurodicus floccissimus]SPP32406.1 hypothetical protein ARAF_2569 [Arsenophonus endosymbiont of Aleurodicus floccissimus]